MLKSITIENFFGFSEAQTIHLNPEVNVLVGINGSGKSNFIKAIRLLYESVVGMGLQKLLLEEWVGLDNVINFSQLRKDAMRLTYEFKDQYNEQTERSFYYEISIKKVGLLNYILSEKVYDNHQEIYLAIKKGNGYIKSNDFPENRTIEITNDIYFENNRKVVFEPQELVAVQFAKKLPFTILHIDYLFDFFVSKSVVYAYWDTTYQSPVRTARPFNVNDKLLPNGENLVQVLNSLQANHSLDYAKIENALKEINPNFKNIHFSLIGSLQTISLVEKDLAKSVDILHISDGTLRFLLLLSILYNPERGTLVCLDEPEIGLHPDMINTIAEGIKYAAQTGTQMFIATHSPLLLNAFELEDILIFEKDENNKSVVKTKSEDDFADWQGEFLAGQMWLRGQLGGTRW